MTMLADIGIGPISIPTPGDVVGALKNAVLDVADAVFDKIIEWIAGLLAQAVGKVTDALVTLLSAIKPTLTPGGGIENAAPIQQSIAGMAAMLVTIFFIFRIIHGIITGQAGQNLKATIIDLPMVIIGTLFFGFLCYTLLALVDAFSDPLISDYATTLDETVKKLYSQEGIVQGGVFVIIFSLLYIIAAVFLCFELFVRSSLIYLVVMFAPLAIATRIWGPTRSYARRATETAVALIFSKLAIAVTLATGASLMSGATEDGGNVAMIQGSAILLLAAFMPFGLMRVIPMMEGAIAGEGVARSMGAKAAVGGIAAAGGVQLAGKGLGKAIGSKGQGGSSGSKSNTPGSTPDNRGADGPTPPSSPVSPGGGGPSSSGPIIRPGASGAGAKAGTSASESSTTPSAPSSSPSAGGADSSSTANLSTQSASTSSAGSEVSNAGALATSTSTNASESSNAGSQGSSASPNGPEVSKPGLRGSSTTVASPPADNPTTAADKTVRTPPLKNRSGPNSKEARNSNQTIAASTNSSPPAMQQTSTAPRASRTSTPAVAKEPAAPPVQPITTPTASQTSPPVLASNSAGRTTSPEPTVPSTDRQAEPGAAAKSPSASRQQATSALPASMTSSPSPATPSATAPTPLRAGETSPAKSIASSRTIERPAPKSAASSTESEKP
jgi:type IV secretion system protein TrbL